VIAALAALDGPLQGALQPPGPPLEHSLNTCQEEAGDTYKAITAWIWQLFNECSTSTASAPMLETGVFRPANLGGGTGPPAPVMHAVRYGADGVPKHEVAELLKFKMRYGRPHVLVDRPWPRRVGRQVGAAGEPDQAGPTARRPSRDRPHPT
jgi:hypothetical protein